MIQIIIEYLSPLSCRQSFSLQCRRKYLPLLNPTINASVNSAPVVSTILQVKGRHHCPFPKVKGNFETSYNSHYVPFEVSKAPYQMPPYSFNERHYAPEVLTSHYKENYKAVSLPHSGSSQTNRFESIGVQLICY